MKGPRPDFSVIIPTFKRPRALGRLLSALSGMDYPRQHFEVIVVDDGSEMSVQPTVERFRQKLSILFLRQENTGPAGARNRAAAHARGWILAFVDDDCEPVPGWLRSFREALHKTPHAVCGGPTANSLTMNPFSSATQKLADFLQSGDRPSGSNSVFFAANNLCVARQDFLDVGGFDASMRFGEDREFCHRWAARGRTFQYVPNALVRHSHQLQLITFLQLHFQYGHGSGMFRKRCAAKRLPPAEFNSIGWYAKLILAGFRGQPFGYGVLLSVLLAVSQAAASAGMLWNTVEHHAQSLRGKPWPPPAEVADEANPLCVQTSAEERERI